MKLFTAFALAGSLLAVAPTVSAQQQAASPYTPALPSMAPLSWGWGP